MTFSAELDALPDREAAFDALVASTSWNAWSLLRDDLGRSTEAARAAMGHAVSAVLRVQA